MIEAVILYGSRARQDGVIGSDTDLLGITNSTIPFKNYDSQGLTFHTYPFLWMIELAEKGSLFALHIVREGVAVYDPFNRLKSLQNAMIIKESYLGEIEVSRRIIKAITCLSQEQFSPLLQSRYFWALRTMLVACSVEANSPTFGPDGLESFFNIKDLALHIRERGQATLERCREVSGKVMSTLIAHDNGDENKIDNLEALLTAGGIAAGTANEILYISK